MKSIERCEYFEFYWVEKSIAKYILSIKKKEKETLLKVNFQINFTG